MKFQKLYFSNVIIKTLNNVNLKLQGRCNDNEILCAILPYF